VNLPEFLKSRSFDSSLLFGFYGGGNYGDELLLETLANLLKQQGAKDVSIAFQYPENYGRFHHDFGYPRVNMHDRKAVLRAIFGKKNIMVGGGGLWGLDTNTNILLLSVLLFISRWFFGKNVYLLNVGFYNSATRLGRVSAWLAGKAAKQIIARDPETYANFKAINKHTVQDVDMAWYINSIDLTPYASEAEELEHQLSLPSPQGKTTFITVRRFRPDKPSQFNDAPVILALMEPRHIDPEGYKLLATLQQGRPNVHVIDFSYNPLALFALFAKHRDNLVYIGPQFHGIITAHLNHIPFLPVSYDNKVTQLLQKIGGEQQTIIPIADITPQHLQRLAGTAQG
jgi:polysaccharide pyruvyl transferase WcaK-like protein